MENALLIFEFLRIYCLCILLHIGCESKMKEEAGPEIHIRKPSDARKNIVLRAEPPFPGY